MKMIRLTVAVTVLAALFAGVSAQKSAVQPYEFKTSWESKNPIDRLVMEKLDALGIESANVCSDAVFIRRAYLDVIGTLPSAQEVSQFLSNRNQGKRRALIDRLLERDEFADYWALKWCDLLRVKSEFPINLWPNAVQAYYRWIHDCLKEGMPYDEFVRALLTSSGSNFRVPPVNFYRAAQQKEPEAIARMVALTFMGERAEKWPKERLSEMGVFFSQIGFKASDEWKEEIVFFDFQKEVETADGSQRINTRFPDGTNAVIQPGEDPREVFANWLIQPRNAWFARNIVNRIWSWLLGRGIIHEPDDIRPDNPPQNPELLAFLEKQLVQEKYDLKQIYRLILNSRTYQLSSIPASENPEAEKNFAFYPVRRLEAEVLIDALCQITGTTEEYSSPIPEPFTFIPEDQRSIQLPDGSITSPFLEAFGRPPRDTGLESERSNRITSGQSLHLLNSSHIQRKIERSQVLRKLFQAGQRSRGRAIGQLYLTVLSRFPTKEELNVVEEYSKSGEMSGRDVLTDLTWALINSAEFLYRH